MKNIKIPRLLAAALCAFATALTQASTYDQARIHQKLQSAELVAEIAINGRSAHPSALYQTVTRSVATIERIVDARGALRELRTGDSISIESPGGERNGVGVLYTGSPRPYMNRRYLAYLNRMPSGQYAITASHFGLQPLDGERAYSRNRTDGTNGEGNGPFLRWDTTYFPIPYFIDSESFRDHDDFIPAIDASFTSWRNPKDLLVEFMAVGCSRNARVENDGVNNVILLRSGWTFDSDAIAITRSFYVAGSEPRAGVILDADIILNGEAHRFTTTNQPSSHDVQNIVTHEVGHFLGLGHEITPQNSSAVMFAIANTNETNKRTLSSNDLAGVREIYNGTGEKLQPPSTLAMCTIPTGQRGCASVAMPAGPVNATQVIVTVMQWLLMLVALPIGRLLYRRPDPRSAPPEPDKQLRRAKFRD